MMKKMIMLGGKQKRRERERERERGRERERERESPLLTPSTPETHYKTQVKRYWRGPRLGKCGGGETSTYRNIATTGVKSASRWATMRSTLMCG